MVDTYSLILVYARWLALIAAGLAAMVPGCAHAFAAQYTNVYITSSNPQFIAPTELGACQNWFPTSGYTGGTQTGGVTGDRYCQIWTGSPTPNTGGGWWANGVQVTYGQRYICPAGSTEAGGNCTCTAPNVEQAGPPITCSAPVTCPSGGDIVPLDINLGWAPVGQFPGRGIPQPLCVNNCLKAAGGISIKIPVGAPVNGMAEWFASGNFSNVGGSCSENSVLPATEPPPPCAAGGGTVNGVSVCLGSGQVSADASTNARDAASAAASAAAASGADPVGQAAAAAAASTSATNTTYAGGSRAQALAAGAAAGAAATANAGAAALPNGMPDPGAAARAQAAAANALGAALAQGNGAIQAAAQAVTSAAAAVGLQGAGFAVAQAAALTAVNAAIAAGKSASEAAAAGTSAGLQSIMNATANAAPGVAGVSAAARDSAVAFALAQGRTQAVATAAGEAASAAASRALSSGLSTSASLQAGVAAGVVSMNGGTAAAAATAGAGAGAGAGSSGSGSGGGGKGDGTGNPVSEFCDKNPEAKICKKEVDSRFSGACGAPPVCEGDAVSCAIAAAVFETNCMFKKPSTESALYEAKKGLTGSQVDNLPGNETIAIGANSFSQDSLIGGGTGLADLSITVAGHSVVLPMSSLNIWLARLGSLLLAVTGILCARIVVRG